MKHIGIICVTSVGATICQNAIVSAAAEQYPSGRHPEITMHAFSFERYKETVKEKNWDKMADIILESIEKVKLTGAEFAIIPSNTPFYSKRIIEEASLPVIDLIDITVKECKRRGFQRVAILGTMATMRDGLYANPLQGEGIIPVIPDLSVCERINNLIMNEIIPSKIKPTSVAQVKADIRALPCDAVILGCTELSLYKEEDLQMPCIDTTDFLAKTALAYALHPTPELEKRLFSGSRESTIKTGLFR